MTGLKIAPMKRFLGLLEIDSQDPDYMKTSSVNLLITLSAQMYEEEMAAVRAEMLEDEKFSLGMIFSVGFLFLISSHGRATLEIAEKVWFCTVLHLHVYEQQESHLLDEARR